MAQSHFVGMIERRLDRREFMSIPWTHWPLLFVFTALCGACTTTSRTQSESPLPRLASEAALEIPPRLESERERLQTALVAAEDRLEAFARSNGLSSYLSQPLVTRIVLVESKVAYDELVRAKSNLPLSTPIPKTFVAAVQGVELWTLNAAEIEALNPADAVDSEFYSKLLAHELAHALHVRYLDGDEDKMGPTWFFEGLAVVAADQYPNIHWRDIEAEAASLIRDPRRGDYRKYGALVRRLLSTHKLRELLDRAGTMDFNEWAIKTLYRNAAGPKRAHERND